MVNKEKNFSYGDIWRSPIQYNVNDVRLEEVEPEELTKNRIFIEWLKSNHYKVFLDHSGLFCGINNQPGFALTDMGSRRMFINGNYSDKIKSVLMQHEMGHVLLFNGYQFTSVTPNNLRSNISKVIYTPNNIRNFGMSQLLTLENIVQDIIIETTSGESCVCSSVMTEHRHNAGVKHLPDLEKVQTIAKDSAANFLKKENKEKTENYPDETLQRLESIITYMLMDLDHDMEQIQDFLENTKNFKAYEDYEIYKNRMELYKLNNIKTKLESREKKVKNNPKRLAIIKKSLNNVDKKIAINEQEKDDGTLQAKAKKGQERAIKIGKGHEKKNLAIKEALEEALKEIKDQMNARGISPLPKIDLQGGPTEETEESSKSSRKRNKKSSGKNQKESGEEQKESDKNKDSENKSDENDKDSESKNEQSSDDENEENSSGSSSESESSDSGDSSDGDEDEENSSGANSESESSDGSQNDDSDGNGSTSDHNDDSSEEGKDKEEGSVDGEKDHTISAQDNPQGEDSDGTPSHSFDCGFPIPSILNVKQTSTLSNILMKVDAHYSGRKVVIDADEGNETAGKNKKSLERESTYFRSSKREFSPSDMMKGKRKLYKAGVNILVGLDISGSMSREWTSMFKELSKFVEDLKIQIDVENVTFFTYNHALKEHSDDIKNLRLVASGSNAFPKVYVEVMKTLPVFDNNEIILVTDCGDSLGWPLSKVAKVMKNNNEVNTHISVVDTEGAGFKHLENYDPKDWDFYHYSDMTLMDKLSDSIKNLIESD